MRHQAWRHLAVAAVALAFALPAQAQSRPAHSSGWSARTWLEGWQERRGPEHVEKVTKTFKVGAAGTLDLSNVAGDILVNEGGGDTITVEATKKVRARDANEAKQQFANTTLIFAERAGRVEVKVDYIGRGNHAWVDYVVTAPSGTRLYLRSVSGDIRATGFKGELRAETVSGDVTLLKSPGIIMAKSVSGDVEVEGATGHDELATNSVSGDIVIRDARARQITAETISGEVQMLQVGCERAVVKSMSGDVTYVGSLARGGRYEMQSHSGGIHLTIPGDVGFELNARSFSGNLRSDLPVNAKVQDSRGERHSMRRNLQGTFGDGSAVLLLNSFSGDITVAKK